MREFADSGLTRRRIGALGALGVLRGRRANGSDFPIEASISQVRVGALRHFTVILRDITERHQAEIELRNAVTQQRARQFQQRTGLVCTLHTDPDLPALPLALAVDLYYIAQEALTHVARHAQAKRVAVFLLTEAKGVRLEVVDDGIGTDAPALGDRQSLGLLAMHERALQCGGTLRLDAATPRGTPLVVQVPLAT